MNKLISVIVPVYNSEKFLSRCVTSIMKQTYSNLEIILVDDGSTDNSPQICDKFALCDSRIKVIHKRNEGSSSARNRGMLESKGDYLGFVDSDDCIRKDMYEVLLTNMLKYNSDMVKSDFYTSSNEKDLPYIGNEEVTEYDSESAMDNFMFEKYSSTKHLKSTIWDGLYKRELFLTNNLDGENKLVISFPKGKIYEDTYILPQLLLKINSVIHIAGSFYFYFMNEDSVMHSAVSVREINSRNLWRDIDQLLKKNTNRYISVCVNNWSVMYIDLLNKIYNSDLKECYFNQILEELLADRQYLNKYLKNKNIKRTLNVIGHYEVYRILQKYAGKFFY